MGHVTIDVTISGPKGEHQLKSILLDTGASYSVFSEEVLKDIGAFKLSVKAPIELGDGKVVQADCYPAILGLEDRQGPIIAVTFEGAKSVIGVHSLESLGLKVNPVTGELEGTRPKGIAYFYTSCVTQIAA